MKRLVCSLLIVTISIVGCAGNAPNPIAVYRPGDENRSCSALKAEIANIDKQITRKQSEKKKQESDNFWCFVGGVFVILPWFWMDFKDNEKAEIDALEQRKDALVVIAADKNCDF